VFAALAISRWLEDTTGWSIKKFVRTARRYRTIQIQTGQHTLTAEQPLPDDLRQALNRIHERWCAPIWPNSGHSAGGRYLLRYTASSLPACSLISSPACMGDPLRIAAAMAAWSARDSAARSSASIKQPHAIALSVRARSVSSWRFPDALATT
jgi:hypothetical protein